MFKVACYLSFVVSMILSGSLCVGSVKIYNIINVPSISFGLAMGWVSLESGESGESDESSTALVGAAAVTFLAGALTMPVAARAIAAGRKRAMLATSAAFIVCWSLKLCGGSWSVVLARAAAGLGGTAAWVIPPMLAVEMCARGVRGAAAVSLVLAHNVGFLLMYLAADYEMPHRTVLVCCLGLSVTHFIAYMFVPESPAYLAAHGKHEEARVALAWCRGVPADTASATLDEELKALPEPDLEPVSPFRLAKDMLSEPRRRRAFVIALVAVVGQEISGVLTLLQFAERVFSLARDEGGEGGETGRGARSAASDAVVLGVVQLVASALALYLVEKIGRRPLFVWGALATGVCLGGGAGAVWAGSRNGALAALAAAVFADSAGLQPAPYALLAEMFTYEYRGCASLLVTAASDLGNAVEIVVFPSLVHAAGLTVALAVAAALTLAVAAFAALAVPETMNRTPEEIYEALCPGKVSDPTDVNVEKNLTNQKVKISDDDEILKEVCDNIMLENDDADHNGDGESKAEVLNEEQKNSEVPISSRMQYQALCPGKDSDQDPTDVNVQKNLTNQKVSRNDDNEILKEVCNKVILGNYDSNHNGDGDSKAEVFNEEQKNNEVPISRIQDKEQYNCCPQSNDDVITYYHKDASQLGCDDIVPKHLSNLVSSVDVKSILSEDAKDPGILRTGSNTNKERWPSNNDYVLPSEVGVQNAQSNFTVHEYSKRSEETECTNL